MTVRLAGIGLGGLGLRELAAVAEFDDVAVVAGADPDPDAREAFEAAHDAPAYAEYEALLSDHEGELDAAVIATPHTLHYEQAMACLSAGIHVFVEKPMTTDVDRAEALVRMADQRGVTLAVGYQRHFDPRYRAFRRMVDTGRIGEVHTVSCYLEQDWIDRFPDAWRTDPELSGGGQLYDSGSHLLDALLWTTGTRPVSVAAMVEYRGEPVDVDSALAIRLDRDGRTVLASVCVTGDGTERPATNEGLFAWGTEGRLAFDGEELRVATDPNDPTEVETDPVSHEDLVEAKLRDFVDAVTHDTEPTVPGEYGLQVVRLTEAAYRASETGRTVDVSAGDGG